jgi:hypothetical protein
MKIESHNHEFQRCCVGICSNKLERYPPLGTLVFHITSFVIVQIVGGLNLKMPS